MALLLSDVVFRLEDSSGNPVSGGYAYFYLTGTTTLTDVYSDNTLATPLPNPVRTNSGGLFINAANAATAIYLGSSTYRVIIKDAAGATIRDIDPLSSSVDIASEAEAKAGDNNTKMMTPLRSAQAIAWLTNTVPGTGYDFKTDGTDTSAEYQAALSALSGRTNRNLVLPDGTALISSGVTVSNIAANIQYGVGTYTHAASITVDQNRNVSFWGSGHGSVISMSAAVDLFGWTGTQPGDAASRLTEFKRLYLKGNSLGLTGIKTPDNAGGVQLFDGWTVIDSVYATGFTTAGIQIGRSNYCTSISHSEIKDSGKGIWIKRDADSNLISNVLSFPRDGALVHIDALQCRMTHSVLDRGGAGSGSAGMGPDIQISSGGGGSGGASFVMGNKHGSEGEVLGRPKVKFYDSDLATATMSFDDFAYNTYYCYVGGAQTVFDVLNPIKDTLIDGNCYIDAGLIINDTPVANGEASAGGVFGPNNRVNNSAGATQYPTQLYRYGGFGFTTTTAPFNVAHINAPNANAGPMQNRLGQPVDFTAWTYNGALMTVTGGQTDPFGGTGAYLLDKATGATSVGISNIFSTTSLLDDMGRPSGAASVTASIAPTNIVSTVTGSITGTVMTSTADLTGQIIAGDVLTGAGVTVGTTVVGQTSSAGVGLGGTYAITPSQTVASTTITGTHVAGVMTVTAVGSGELREGGILSGIGVTAGTVILSQLTGAFGGTGTYLVSPSQTTAATTITGAIRNGRVVAGVWLKADTSLVAGVIVGDGTFGGVMNKQLSLSTAWKYYTFEVGGIQAGLSPSLYIYPGGTTNSGAARIYACNPSVSDFGSEHLHTQVLNQPASLPRELMFTPSLTPAACAANTSAEQTFTVTGLRTGDVVAVNGPAVTAGTGIVNTRVSATSTLALTFANFTAGALTPAAGTYALSVSRARA